MSILRYFQPQGSSLPNPRGDLALSMSSESIASANKEVLEATKSSGIGGKRGQYKKLDDDLRAEIGKYASYHGVAATSRYFSRKLKKKMSESTIRSIRDSFLREAKRKRVEDIEEVTTLPKKKRGRPLLLGNALDEKVQLYLLKVRESGGQLLLG